MLDTLIADIHENNMSLELCRNHNKVQVSLRNYSQIKKESQIFRLDKFAVFRYVVFTT